MDWSDYTRFGFTLFALINPFTKIPYCVSVASEGGSRAILAMATTSTATMISLLMLMHISGEAILSTLGTSLPSFQIGGGLVILLSGLAMLNQSAKPATETTSKPMFDVVHYAKLGVAPLGIPMLAGAGSIAKVTAETHSDFGISDDFHISLIIILVCVVAGVIIASSTLLMRLFGPVVFSILSRLAGLVVVSVAVEVMWHGISAHIQALTAT
jgi:multiple antibiotic resistance protein